MIFGKLPIYIYILYGDISMFTVTQVNGLDGYFT